jgi:hypothetical protein
MVECVDTYLKTPTPPFVKKEVQRRRKENIMVLDVNKYMVMGPNGARYHE